MIQNALDEKNMDKATVYMWTKREKCNGECWLKEEMYEQEKSTNSRHN